MNKVGRDGVDDDGGDGTVAKWCRRRHRRRALTTMMAVTAAMAGGCEGVVNAGGVRANNVNRRGLMPREVNAGGRRRTVPLYRKEI